jgi:serine/threonine protein kinase
MLSLTVDGKVKSSVFSKVGDNIEWAAPEIVRQNSKYDEKSDIYSFGMTAIELAFGRTPFDQFPPLKTLLCKMNFPCPLMPDHGKMSEAFWKVVGRCVHKDPRRRPSAERLLEESIFKHAKNKQHLKSYFGKNGPMPQPNLQGMLIVN